jgi:orotidine-5'-phosphate decarboxylase
MTKQELTQNIFAKRTFLCVGLDVELEKIPSHLLKTADPIFEFNKHIIDATHDYCVAYKPNTAFYEQYGIAGWQAFEKTIQYLKTNYSKHFIIADAKRGDIGNTSAMYARTFFDKRSGGLDFDAVTVAPYMGEDSVKPFLGFENKWVVLLALTSNSGSADFQTMKDGDEKLYERVIRTSQQWATHEQMMYVVGATHAEELAHIRTIAPKHFFLVPGVGAQGGSLQEVAKHGMNSDCGLLVNSSRNIIYASSEENFADVAAAEARRMKREMEKLLG